jgi:hypothetical protein
MRQRPGLHPGQHGMLEPWSLLAWKECGDEEDQPRTAPDQR